jgi:hypothetical protein
MTEPEMPDRFAAICRHPCGGITALIGKTACGTTCSGVAWCECGTVITIGRDGEPCEHLASLAAAARTETP